MKRPYVRPAVLPNDPQRWYAALLAGADEFMRLIYRPRRRALGLPDA